MAMIQQGDQPKQTGDVAEQRSSPASPKLGPNDSRAIVIRSNRVKAGLAAYLVAAVFVLGYFLTRVVANGETPWVALGVAIAVAVPLVIGLIGNRIGSIKTPWIEVSLTAATVTTSTAIPTDDINNTALNASGGSDLAQQLRRLITAPGSQVLELDLRDNNYWWPTRLFLVSALLRDYTDVRRLAFVHGPRRVYVGMAEPDAVCRRVELGTPGLSAAYAAARESAVSAAIDGEQGPQPLRAARPAPSAVVTGRRADDARIVEWIVRQWPEAVQMYAGMPSEIAHPDRVGRSWLAHTLGDDLRSASLAATGGLPDVLTQYSILVGVEPFVALVSDGQLSRVVSRDRLASSVAIACLRQQLTAQN
jgi:hypothetical protein